ncbi:MAG: prepilin-type N-terminal cleavage/methylation domain-containing protein [Patescibacteria group bacterium]|nr:prepilin-type N-terminal cleavage/methylation domain-containing protein [Patescibacteria group bacterium]
MNKYDEKVGGFTLIEMLVALGLFSMVITTAIGIFVSGSSAQKKAMDLFEVQREANYIMETISRELRMAKDINIDQSNNNDSNLTFTNHNGDLITYCISDVDGVCGSGVGYEYFSIDFDNDGTGTRVSSTDVILKNLKFYTNDFSSGNKQSFVTILMDVKSRKRDDTNIKLQTSISMRIYK